MSAGTEGLALATVAEAREAAPEIVSALLEHLDYGRAGLGEARAAVGRGDRAGTRKAVLAHCRRQDGRARFLKAREGRLINHPGGA